VKELSNQQEDFWKYFAEIENALSKKCGKKVFLSPLDWGLIENWQKRGVPLHVILKSINSSDKELSRRKKLNSLRYFRNKIEEEFSLWLKQNVGKTNTATNELTLEKDLPIYLDEKINLVNSAIAESNNELIRKVLVEAVKKLQNLKQANSLRFVEEELEKLEKEINKALLTHTDKHIIQKHMQKVERQMFRYKLRMDEKTYAQNCQLMLLKLLRKELKIPRLGLFDL
jgi:hypothetical protein